jgi:hypothetical protein
MGGPADVWGRGEWLYSAEDSPCGTLARTTTDAADRGVFREKTQHA